MAKLNNQLSLKARAVGFLSRREHTRLELKRKLARYSDDADEIESVLDELQKGNWQSDSRFARAFANKNLAKHGNKRIINDLRQNGVDENLINEIQESLGSSEFDRAYAVWQKKFNAPAENQKEYARQYRFMLGRGFSNDIVRKILSGKFDDF